MSCYLGVRNGGSHCETIEDGITGIANVAASKSGRGRSGRRNDAKCGRKKDDDFWFFNSLHAIRQPTSIIVNHRLCATFPSSCSLLFNSYCILQAKYHQSKQILHPHSK